MPCVIREQAVLLALVMLIKLLPHVKWHGRVELSVDKEDGLTAAGKIGTHIRIAHVVAADNAVDRAKRRIHSGNFLLRQPVEVRKAAVRDDEFDRITAAVAHFQHARPSHGEAVQNDLNVTAEPRLQFIEPQQTVAALRDAPADEPAVALAVSRVVAAEEVKAAAVVVVEVHTGSLRVLGAVAVDDKDYLLAGLFAAGIVKAPERLPVGVDDGAADAPRLAQPLRRAVAQGVIALVVFFSLRQELKKPDVAAEGVFIQLTGKQ